MVNEKRVIAKIPSLLVSSKTSSKRGHAEYERVKRGLTRLKKKKPEEYNNIANQYVTLSEKTESAIFEVSRGS